MGQFHVSVTEVIAAPVEAVYALLADYQHGHPSILPPQYFKELTVEEGGQGAGTVVRVVMETMGNRQTYRFTISEPVPGRVLLEEDASAGAITRFTLEPLDAGRTRVTITTDGRTVDGMRGFVERRLAPALLRRVYQDELRLLDEKLQQRGGQAGFG